MSAYKYKHGLCVMRAQPFHIGHQKIIDKMLQECELVTIALGSIQESHTERNPFDYSTRRQMIENVYKNSSEMDRIGITNKIIETNDWLSKAKASYKNLGKWSVYSIIDNLDEIEYITIEKED